MVALITVQQANDHLRLDMENDGASPSDFSEDDRFDEVTRKIEEATDIIVGYLKKPDHGWTTSTVPPRVRAAILLALSAVWEDREGTGDGDYLRPDGAIARLLVRDRDPAIA
jgi:hypothetical protein